jgi:hypothetical protein
MPETFDVPVEEIISSFFIVLCALKEDRKQSGI